MELDDFTSEAALLDIFDEDEAASAGQARQDRIEAARSASKLYKVKFDEPEWYFEPPIPSKGKDMTMASQEQLKRDLLSIHRLYFHKQWSRAIDLALPYLSDLLASSPSPVASSSNPTPTSETPPPPPAAVVVLTKRQRKKQDKAKVSPGDEAEVLDIVMRSALKLRGEWKTETGEEEAGGRGGIDGIVARLARVCRQGPLSTRPGLLITSAQTLSSTPPALLESPLEPLEALLSAIATNRAPDAFTLLLAEQLSKLSAEALAGIVVGQQQQQKQKIGEGEVEEEIGRLGLSEAGEKTLREVLKREGREKDESDEVVLRSVRSL